jgi:hypothetical protein
MLPRSIDSKIKALDNSLKTVAVIEGFAFAAVFAVLFAAVVFAIDYTTPLPAPARIFLDAAFLIGLAAILAVRIFRPAFKTRSADELALIFEKARPELKDSLISAVQFARAADDPAEAQFQSRELSAVVIEETSSRVENMTTAGAVRSGRAAAALAFVGVLVVLAAAFMVSSPDTTRIFFSRFAALTGEWPMVNALKLDPAPPARIAKGEDLDVIYATERNYRPPAEVYIYSRPSNRGDADWEFSTTKKFAGGIFRYTFKNVVESFEFYAVGGDNTTSVFRVEVTERPRVEKIGLSFDYPKYILDSGFKGPATTRSGSAKVPAGTVVSFGVSTNKPVKKAEICGVQTLSNQTVFEGADILQETGGSSIRGAFAVADSVTYFFKFVDSYGFDSGTNPIKYTLTAVSDKPPRVKILEPEGNRDYTVEASVPIRVRAEDEHSIKTLELRYTVLPGGVAEKNAAEKRIPLKEIGVGTKEVESEYVFDIKALDLKKNDVILYYAAARDFRPDEKTAWGVSEPKNRITLISKQDAPPIIKEMLRRITEALKKAHKAEDQCRTASKGTSEKLGAGAYDTETDRELGAEMSLQGKITGQLEELIGMVENLIRFKESNKLMEDRDKTWLPEIREALNTLAKDKSPAALEHLSKAREAARAAESDLRVQEAIGVQVEILAELQRLIKELQRMEDIQEIITQIIIIEGIEKRLLQDLIDINIGGRKPEK